MFIKKKNGKVTIQCDCRTDFNKILGILNTVNCYDKVVYVPYLTFLIILNGKSYTDFLECLICKIHQPLY